MELPAASWLTATSVGRGGVGAVVTIVVSASAAWFAALTPKIRSRFSGPLSASAPDTARRPLRRAASRSLRGGAVPCQDPDADGLATAGSRRAGKAGTQVGGSGCASAATPLPGQL